MYRGMVRWRVRRAFAQLSAGDLDRFLSVFGPESVFCFAGDHAFGGERRGVSEIRSLFQEMRRHLRDLRVEPVTVVVGGWPWNTVVATRFRVSASLRDGMAYRNEGMQFARVRWARVVEDRLYEDTVLLVQALERTAI